MKIDNNTIFDLWLILVVKWFTFYVDYCTTVNEYMKITLGVKNDF